MPAIVAVLRLFRPLEYDRSAGVAGRNGRNRTGDPCFEFGFEIGHVGNALA